MGILLDKSQKDRCFRRGARKIAGHGVGDALVPSWARGVCSR